jgi:hypothetical protein
VPKRLGRCANIGEADVEAGLGRGQEGGLDKLMYEGKYSSAGMGGNPPRGGGMTIMRDQCMETKQSIMLRGL